MNTKEKIFGLLLEGVPSENHTQMSVIFDEIITNDNSTTTYKYVLPVARRIMHSGRLPLSKDFSDNVLSFVTKFLPLVKEAKDFDEEAKILANVADEFHVRYPNW